MATDLVEATEKKSSKRPYTGDPQFSPTAVGLRIKEMRERLHPFTSQDSLSLKIGKSRAAIGQWESGGSYPALADFVTLAKHLNTSAEYLAFGRLEKPVRPAPEGKRVPLMNYEVKADFPKVGEMIVSNEFYARLITPGEHGAKITAFALPSDHLIDGCREGDIVFIDTRLKTPEGTGETYLTAGPFNRAYTVTPGEKPGHWTVKAENGKATQVPSDGPLPVIGRIVGHMASEV